MCKLLATDWSGRQQPPREGAVLDHPSPLIMDKDAGVRTGHPTEASALPPAVDQRHGLRPRIDPVAVLLSPNRPQSFQPPTPVLFGRCPVRQRALAGAPARELAALRGHGFGRRVASPDIGAKTKTAIADAIDAMAITRPMWVRIQTFAAPAVPFVSTSEDIGRWSHERVPVIIT